jgi:multidrug resistance efflux pump
VARLEVPDLASRIAQKGAEVREARARLRLLEAGPRYEEIMEQRRRVERARDWRDAARKDLARARQALQAELARLDRHIAQHQAELDAAQEAQGRARRLRGTGALAPEQYQEAERKWLVAQAQLGQAQFEKRRREALGTREAIAGLDAEAELAHREKDLAETQATLNLLEAGTRPEEIEAERARLARLQEEARYLEGLPARLAVVSPARGVISTAHLKEKVGQHVAEGGLICLVEGSDGLEAEITVAEQDVTRVRVGQEVGLKARALPFDTCSARVERIAPAARRGEVQSSVTVCCRLDQAPADLRPDMTGYARIYTGPRPAGVILVDRVLRYVRTEFWW